MPYNDVQIIYILCALVQYIHVCTYIHSNSLDKKLTNEWMQTIYFAGYRFQNVPIRNTSLT